MGVSRFTSFLESFDEDDGIKGKQWEFVSQWFLKTDEVYSSLLREVWLWDEWPEKKYRETGIDLVAEANDGTLWAIQCKNYSVERNVPRNEISKFITASEANGRFSARLLISTTYDVSGTVREEMPGYRPPLYFCLRHDLEDRDWPKTYEQWAAKRFPKKKKVSLYPHQADAVRDTVKGLSQHNRVQTLMACGTGKTYVGLRVHEEVRSSRTLVLVPSLLLLKQTIRQWIEKRQVFFEFLPVCSDKQMGYANDDPAITSESELGYPATTQSATIKAFLEKSAPRVIFSTYKSSPMVAQAVAETEFEFDVVIADEAHRCAGRVDGMWTTVLHQDQLPAQKRVFMTATPRLYKPRKNAVVPFTSMENKAHFGPVVHELTFRRAIEKGLLSKWQVVCIGIDEELYRQYVERGTPLELEKNEQTDARSLATYIGLAKAMRDHDLRRVITFHGRRDKATRFARNLPKIVEWMPLEERPTGDLWAKGMYDAGNISTGRRAAMLRALENIQPGQRGVLSNVQCLGEGVDVPSIDAVAFIEPRSSPRDIVQAVGRAIRKSPEKADTATIVLPVFIGNSEDAVEAVEKSGFRQCWSVLVALQTHDELLRETLGVARRAFNPVGDGELPPLPDNIVFEMPQSVTADFSRAIRARMLRYASIPLELSETQILVWADAYYEKCGEWPYKTSGPVAEAPGETWNAIHIALRRRGRGLTAGLSLGAFLRKNNRFTDRTLTDAVILKLIDAHFKRENEYPTSKSGRVVDAVGKDTWRAIDAALYHGVRGREGGSSLSQFSEHHGRVVDRNFTEQMILETIDAHYKKYGKYPTEMSGDVTGMPGETWSKIHSAFRNGYRGLSDSECSSLSQFRKKHGRVVDRNFTEQMILEAIDAYYKEYDKYPHPDSGAVIGMSGETWSTIHSAFVAGRRGLSDSGCSSLSQFKKKHKRVSVLALTEQIILERIDAHFAEYGEYPHSNSGVVIGMPSETWKKFNSALLKKNRGLTAGVSLAVFMKMNGRGVVLNEGQILVCADRYKKSTGRWPASKKQFGNFDYLPGVVLTWKQVDAALRFGYRGLPAGSSLSILLKKSGRVQPSVNKIWELAVAYKQKNGDFPTKDSGGLTGYVHETWELIDRYVRQGAPGLMKPMTLSEFFKTKSPRRRRD